MQFSSDTRMVQSEVFCVDAVFPRETSNPKSQCFTFYGSNLYSNRILEYSGLIFLSLSYSDSTQQRIIHKPMGNLEGSKFKMFDRDDIVSVLRLEKRRDYSPSRTIYTMQGRSTESASLSSNRRGDG